MGRAVYVVVIMLIRLTRARPSHRRNPDVAFARARAARGVSLGDARVVA
jgi:hypothetical protein